MDPEIFGVLSDGEDKLQLSSQSGSVTFSRGRWVLVLAHLQAGLNGAVETADPVTQIKDVTVSTVTGQIGMVLKTDSGIRLFISFDTDGVKHLQAALSEADALRPQFSRPQ